MMKYENVMDELEYLVTDAKIECNESLIMLKNLIDIIKSTILQRNMLIGMKESFTASRIQKKIDDLICEYSNEKETIEAKLDGYSFTYGSATIDSLNEKIDSLTIMKQNFEIKILEIISEYCKYDSNNQKDLELTCIDKLFSNNSSNILFFRNPIVDKDKGINYTLIDKVFGLLKDKKNIESIVNVITLNKEIESLHEEINQLSLAQLHSDEINDMRILESNVRNDDTRLMKLSASYEKLKATQEKYDKNILFKIPFLDSVARDNRKRMINTDKEGNALYIKRTKLQLKYQSIYNKLISQGLKPETINNFPFTYSVCTVNNRLEYTKAKLEKKQDDFDSIYANLSINIKEMFENDYETLSNIVEYILSNQSSHICFYILYILSNLENIVIGYIESNSVDLFKIGELSNVIQENFSQEINKIAANNAKEKAKLF